MICNCFTPYMTGVILQHYQERIAQARSPQELEFILDQIHYHSRRLSRAMRQIVCPKPTSHERGIHHP